MKPVLLRTGEAFARVRAAGVEMSRRSFETKVMASIGRKVDARWFIRRTALDGWIKRQRRAAIISLAAYCRRRGLTRYRAMLELRPWDASAKQNGGRVLVGTPRRVRVCIDELRRVLRRSARRADTDAARQLRRLRVTW